MPKQPDSRSVVGSAGSAGSARSPTRAKLQAFGVSPSVGRCKELPALPALPANYNRAAIGWDKGE
jgi:hypothetical protein